MNLKEVAEPLFTFGPSWTLANNLHKLIQVLDSGQRRSFTICQSISEHSIFMNGNHAKVSLAIGVSMVLASNILIYFQPRLKFRLRTLA